MGTQHDVVAAAPPVRHVSLSRRFRDVVSRFLHGIQIVKTLLVRLYFYDWYRNPSVRSCSANRRTSNVNNTCVLHKKNKKQSYECTRLHLANDTHTHTMVTVNTTKLLITRSNSDCFYTLKVLKINRKLFHFVFITFIRQK